MNPARLILGLLVVISFYQIGCTSKPAQPTPPAVESSREPSNTPKIVGLICEDDREQKVHM